MCLETSASESEEKDLNKCMFAGKMCLTYLISLMKNVAKSSAVRVDK